MKQDTIVMFGKDRFTQSLCIFEIEILFLFHNQIIFNNLPVLGVRLIFLVLFLIVNFEMHTYCRIIQFTDKFRI